MLYALQNNSAPPYDAGTGLELNVVAVVLFGGVSIFGGRGTSLGVVLSVLVIGSFDEAALTLPQRERRGAGQIFFGVLLLASVLLAERRGGLPSPPAHR